MLQGRLSASQAAPQNDVVKKCHCLSVNAKILKSQYDKAALDVLISKYLTYYEDLECQSCIPSKAQRAFGLTYPINFRWKFDF